jgi:hypothetical protein
MAENKEGITTNREVTTEEILQVVSWLKAEDLKSLRKFLEEFQYPHEVLSAFKKLIPHLQGNSELQKTLEQECNAVLREPHRKRICGIRWQGEPDFMLASA